MHLQLKEHVNEPEMHFISDSFTCLSNKRNSIEWLLTPAARRVLKLIDNDVDKTTKKLGDNARQKDL